MAAAFASVADVRAAERAVLTRSSLNAVFAGEYNEHQQQSQSKQQSKQASAEANEGLSDVLRRLHVTVCAGVKSNKNSINSINSNSADSNTDSTFPFDVRFAAMRALQRIFQLVLSTQFDSLDNQSVDFSWRDSLSVLEERTPWLLCFASQKRLKQRLSLLRSKSKDSDSSSLAVAGLIRVTEVQMAYAEFVIGLLSIMVAPATGEPADALSIAALELLVQFAVLEHDVHRIFAKQNKTQKSAAQAADGIAALVVHRLLLVGASSDVQTAFLEKFVQGDASIRHIALKNVKSALQQATKEAPADPAAFAHRVILMLAAVCMGKGGDSAGGASADGVLMRKASTTLDVPVFEFCWLQALKLPGLQDETLCIALRHLPDGVLPRIRKPHILLDFLLAAFRKGGALAVLSLRSLFVMIVRHNLDFPAFYNHVYAWLTHSGSQLIHSLHVGDAHHDVTLSELLSLLETFLSSTQLPRYLVAAFAKRLARLALFSPPVAAHGLAILCYGLLQQHASVRTLVHRSVAGIGGSGRPTLVLTLPSGPKPESAALPAIIAEARDRPVRKRLANSDYRASLAIGSKAGDTFPLGVAIEQAVGPVTDVASPAPSKRLRSHSNGKSSSITEESSSAIQQSRAPDMRQDPFKDDTDDPSGANAAASSLWEVKSLLSHYDANVCRVARLITESTFEAKIPVSSALSVASSEARLGGFSQLVAVELARKGRSSSASSVPLASEATHRLLGSAFGEAWHPFAA